MKVLAINGSPKRNGNTAALLTYVLDEIKSAGGIDTELLQLSGKKLSGCTACSSCIRNANGRCIIDDDMNEIISKMVEADGIIIGSPTYFADVTAEIKAVIDRAGYVTGASGKTLRRKVGAGVMAVRRAGAIHGFETINNFFLINEMIVPGSSYWNIGVGRMPGDVHNDLEGVETMKTLGRNFAWLLQKIKA